MVAAGAGLYLQKLVEMNVEGSKKLLESLGRGKIWGEQKHDSLYKCQNAAPCQLNLSITLQTRSSLKTTLGTTTKQMVDASSLLFYQHGIVEKRLTLMAKGS
uniref:Uncharacterized protein n=1 Tax=Cucumis melo TaxID=3656 RepID=A0A9I9EM42_CUCME